MGRRKFGKFQRECGGDCLRLTLEIGVRDSGTFFPASLGEHDNLSQL